MVSHLFYSFLTLKFRVPMKKYFHLLNIILVQKINSLSLKKVTSMDPKQGMYIPISRNAFLGEIATAILAGILKSS